MDHHFKNIKSRNKDLIIPNKIQNEFTLDDSRTKKDRILRSLWNPSIYFYFALIVINTIACVLYATDIIS